LPAFEQRTKKDFAAPAALHCAGRLQRLLPVWSAPVAAALGPAPEVDDEPHERNEHEQPDNRQPASVDI
jgi:hypothetical protein